MTKTPPPKPEDYIVVDGSDGPRRDFRISVGLREGWDAEGRVFDVSEAVHAYLGHLPDAAIEAMLNELAAELGAALGQERIYVAFADRTWILDASEHDRGA